MVLQMMEMSERQLPRFRTEIMMIATTLLSGKEVIRGVGRGCHSDSLTFFQKASFEVTHCCHTFAPKSPA